jgi:acyl carrier protein
MARDLRELVGTVLDVPTEEITDDSSPLSVPTWDSLNHLKLIVAIEEEFGVRFTAPEVVDIACYSDLRQALARKGVAGA